MKKFTVTLFLIFSMFFCLTGIISTSDATMVISDSQNVSSTFYQEENQNNSINSNNIQNNGLNNSEDDIIPNNSSGSNGNDNNDGIILQTKINPNSKTNNTASTQSLLINASSLSGNAISYNQISFNADQIIAASREVKGYIETNHQLPSSISMNGTNIGMYSFLYLLSTVLQNLYNNNNNSLNLINYNGPQVEREDINSGNMGISEYIHIADVVKVYMDKTYYVPGYAFGTSLGTYFGWKSMIYTFSNVLDNYNNTKKLPGSVSIKPWKIVSDPNAATFTKDQVVNAAITLKNYVEANHALPSTVTVNGKQIGMYSFLYLLSFVLQNIYNNNNSTIDTWTFNGPEAQKEDIHVGDMGLSECIHIADIVKVYMDKTNYVPGYAYGTSLGTYFGWQTMIYTFSSVLASYNTTKTLPGSLSVKPWKLLSDTNLANFTKDQIVTAAATVKSQIEANHALPSTVTVNGKQIGMYSFLYLLSFVVQNIYNNNNVSVNTWTFNGPEIQKEDIRIGDMSKAEYIHIADIVKVYMDKTGYVPGYAYGTSLGTYFGWQTMIYMYSKILDNYNTTKTLPSNMSIKPWRIVSDPNITSFTKDQVINAAVWVKSYVDANYQLPSTVNINGKSIGMYSFLYLLSFLVQNIYGNNNGTVDTMSFNGPQVDKESIIPGNIGKSEYIKIADVVKVYMDKTGIVPGYAYGTSLGTYFAWQAMIYMYSNILANYNSTKVLPDSIVVKPWYVLSKSFKIDIIISGTGGYVTDNAVINSNIQQSTETYKVVQSAVSGTPILTFGFGSGHKVMIVAGVHGNELPAQLAAIRLINYLNGKSLNGTVYIIPFAIPSSTATNSRFWNGQNPNSVANVAGTPTNQILNFARQLNVNALGDFHSTQPGGVPGQDSAMYSLNPTYESYLIASYISDQTGSTLTGAYQAGVDYPGALEDVCNLAGVPAVTCEVLSSHGTIDSGSVDRSFNQMLAFLRYEKII